MTTFDPSRVSAVIFDIGGVFTYPTFHPVRNKLTTWGIEHLDDEPFMRAHHRGVHDLTVARRDGRVTSHSEDHWFIYDHAYGAELGVGEERMAELRPTIRTDWDWVHRGNVAAFARIVESGLPTAVVSNNDGTAEDQLRAAGAAQVGPGPLPSVAAIVDSTIVGIMKPDPAIFTPALEAVGVEPDRALYVGDTVYADVDGALAAGMQVVQLDPFDDHVDFDHSRLPDVAAVEAALADRPSAFRASR